MGHKYNNDRLEQGLQCIFAFLLNHGGTSSCEKLCTVLADHFKVTPDLANTLGFVQYGIMEGTLSFSPSLDGEDKSLVVSLARIPLVKDTSENFISELRNFADLLEKADKGEVPSFDLALKTRRHSRLIMRVLYPALVEFEKS